MTKEIKVIPAFTTKVNEDQGVVEHIFAVFGNVDLGNDVLHPGSFAKTIAERGNKVRVLDQHKADSIMHALGKPMEMREIPRTQLPDVVLDEFPDATGGVWARTKFLMDTPEGKGAFIRIRDGAVDEWSFAYDPLDVDYSKREVDGEEVTVRNIRTLKLYEYSPVLWGMNPATSTVSAKDRKDEKPWDVFEVDDQFCVYRIDEDGDRTGSSLGCHDTEDEARQQVEALYAQEESSEGPDSEEKDEQLSPEEKVTHRPPENKATNLSQLVTTVARAFYAQYPDIHNEENGTHIVYWVEQVWDEFVIVRQEGNMGEHLWQVNYIAMDDSVNFDMPQEWVEVEMVPTPKQSTTTPTATGNRAVDNQPDDKQAGPDDDGPPTSEMLRLIEIEEEELSLIEVQNVRTN